jgi:hypothetical protein
MDSKGVTAMRDSVAPAQKPAMTVAGPETLPSASARRDLYESKATNPGGCYWMLNLYVGR